MLDRFIPRMPFSRLLLTTTLCAVLGAIAGRQSRPVVMETVVAASTKPVISPTQAAASFQVRPPPFTSSTASMEWVRAQMEKGDTTASERFFRKDAGLTDEQRLSLARELVQNGRRMDPRVLARIVMSLPRGDESDRLLWRLVSDWCSYDAEDALRFIEVLPADRLNTAGILVNSAFGLGDLPAERLLAFAATLNDKGRAYLVEGLVGFADQAGSWRNTSAVLAKLNVKPEKEAVSAEWFLGRNLGEIDPQAIESQIAAETDPVKRDKLLSGYAQAVEGTDPERSIALEAQTTNSAGNVRERVESWLYIDRAAALAWLQIDAARQLMDRTARVELLRTYQLEATP